MYDSKAKKIISIRDVSDDLHPEYKDATDERLSHLFPLKYKPSSPLKSWQDLDDFVQEVLLSSSQSKSAGCRPHLETDCSPSATGQIQTINTENAKDFLKRQNFSVIEVFQTKCPGCKDIDPLLNQIKDGLQAKLGKSKVDLARINIFNELPFLADTAVTPCFLVHNSRTGKFSQVQLKAKGDAANEEQTEDERKQQLAQQIIDGIEEEIKR